MARIIERLEQVGNGYAALYCDLWGCLHDGVAAFPEAVAALERFKAAGGAVLLLTNSPRPRRDVMRQLALLGVPRGCYDDVVSSGDAAQAAMAAGLVGRRVHHIGPERDLVFFEDETGQPIEVERVGLEEAEGIVCTGLFDDRSETPEDYRATILYGVNKGLKLLCANPDIVVDVGDQRIYCAGAIAAAYTDAGGTSLYFGKPHAPIYELARRRLEAARGPRCRRGRSCARATASSPTSRVRWARISIRSSSPAGSPPRRPGRARSGGRTRSGCGPISPRRS
jgi:HAD superfamily hydrolase (TIGR01459 family)